MLINKMLNDPTYCLNSYTHSECCQSIFLVVLCSIVVLLNIIGFIQVYRSTNLTMKFEQYVLFSNMSVGILLLISVFFKYLIIIHIIHFLTFIIVIFIVRRFIKVYRQVSGKYHNEYIFYITFMLINLLFLFGALTFNILKYLNALNGLTQVFIFVVIYGQKLFALFISILCCRIGFKLIFYLKNPIHEIQSKLSIDDDRPSKGSFTFKECSNEDSNENEVYTKKRISQIYVVIFSTLLSYVLLFLLVVISDIWVLETNEFIFAEGIMFSSENDDKNWVVTLYFIILQLPVIGNYISFYYIVRDFYITSIDFSKEPSSISNSNNNYIIEKDLVDKRNNIQLMTRKSNNSNEFISKDYLEDHVFSQKSNTLKDKLTYDDSL